MARPQEPTGETQTKSALNHFVKDTKGLGLEFAVFR